GPHPVGGESDADNFTDAPIEGGAFAPVARVPQAHGLVVVRGGEESAVRRERDRLEVPPAAFALEDRCFGGNIPNDHVVLARSGEHSAIGSEREVTHTPSRGQQTE